MGPRNIAALAAAVAGLLASAPGAAGRDFAPDALNIIPSGQYGALPVPGGADRQALMYDGLTPLFDRVSPGDLTRFFKSARLGASGQGQLTTEEIPRAGATIVRDEYNVPHISGRTNDDVTFAAGWVTAEDRELLMEQARYNGRLAAIDAPGWRALDLIAGLRNFTPTAQTEAEIGKQTAVLRRMGKKGRRVLHDIDVFVAGINAFYKANGKTHAPWRRTDIYALNALKGQFLGEGGDGEVRSAQLLDGLRDRLGQRRGQKAWEDLRQANDPETAVSVDGRFRYRSTPRRRRGAVVLDNGSFEPGPGAGPTPDGGPTPPASNILMAGPSRSLSRRALFVGGPQIGYFYPGLTLEMDLKGPGWQARGATSVPFPGYILIGRREDFTWTLTSAGSDIVDHYAETLCGGSDTMYLYRGRCRNMTSFNAGTVTGGPGDQPVSFLRTVHGTVVGYATVGGRKAAISRKRSSYGRDVVDQLLFRDLTRSPIPNARVFFRAASQSPQTFNAFYADDQNIAMVTTGRLPRRARGVDGALPTDGRGRFEWRGVLPARRHARGINPKGGLLVNWNNKPARGWNAADDQFGYGSIQRNDMLTRLLAKRRRHSLATVTAAMNAAATQDVRAVRFVPVLSQVLRKVPAPSARSARMLELLDAWHGVGSSRLDVDLDGKIDAAGAAVLDASWNLLADAAMKPVLGPLADQLSNSGLMRRFDLPPGGMFTGWHQYMDKDLRRLLGKRVRGPLRVRYCGRGDLKRCATDLWAALEQAGAELAGTQGEDPDAWRADATRERISFRPGLLPLTIRFTNRPTGIQQVISFEGHRARRR